MNRGLIFLVLILFGTQMAFAQGVNIDVPESVRNNIFFRESLRLTNLARLAFQEGDYSTSIRYSERALHYAYLSDEFVTDYVIAAAGRRINYAISINAPLRYPSEFSEAQTAYGEAHDYRVEESWNDAIDAAHRVFAALASIQVAGQVATGQAGRPATQATGQATGQAAGTAPLPAQYTVREWEGYRDCLWNIAGRPWVYNDPSRWRLLLEANRNRMPDPNNPDLIHPGMVLEIPSIRGEHRQDMWDSNRTYPTVR